jgi:hypothetical protein
MPAITSIILADGQNTPVNKTFEVVTAQQGADAPAVWAERSGGTYASFKNMTMSVRRAQNSTSTKVVLRIKDPTVDPVTGAVKLNTLVAIDFTLPDAANLQNRKDILAYAKNLLANAVVADAVHNMSPAY